MGAAYNGSMIAHWTELVIGAWVLLSPWILGFSALTFAKWSNIIVGLIIVIKKIWDIFGEKHTTTNG